MNKKPRGFVLIREYPGSKKVGTFEPYTTGQFISYPQIWHPIYDDETVTTELHEIQVIVKTKPIQK